MEYRAYVQYDWTAVDPAELTIVEGQTCLVKDVNDRGWALVLLEDTGASGWVPNDYLRPLDDDVVEELAPVVVENQAFSQDEVNQAMAALQVASQPPQQERYQQQQQQQPQSNPDAQTCASCNQPIETSALIAKGKHYHQDCFKCTACQVVLTGGFLEREGKIYCEEDYYKAEGFVCTHCAQPIIGARIMGNGKPYHEGCLLCSVCNCSIGNDVLHVKDDKNVCHNCYNTHYAAICATCNLPIEFQIFSALDKSYHQECFVCHEGNHPMPDESFHAHEGNIYCPEHYKKLFAKQCYQCKEDITGQYLDVVNRFFHPKCWKCTACDALLESTGCSIKNDLFYCPTCVVKIPSNTPPKSPTAAAAAPAKAPQTAPAPAAAAAPKAPAVAAAAAPAPTPAPKLAAPAPAAAPASKPAAPAAAPAPSAPAPAKAPEPAQKSSVGLLDTLHAGGDDISTEEMRRRLLEISSKALAESNKEKTADLFPVQETYTHSELMQSERLPPGIDRAKKEKYLADDEFKQIFGMDKTQFAALKGWKQSELKKGAKIF